MGIAKAVLPKTYWGFPVGTAAPAVAGRPPSLTKGVALIITVLAVCMIMIFTANMIINSQVSLEVAVKNRDNIKAEYMAKSGLNLALFLVSIDWGLDLFLSSDQSPTKTDPSDGMGDIWAMLNGLPIGGDTLEMITAAQENFDLNKVNDEDAIDMLKLFDGQFILNIEDEAGKINLNNCTDGQCKEVMIMLEALMSCPAEKAFLEEKSITGKQLAFRIKDWVDKDSKGEPETGYNDEDTPYQKRSPAYTAKNVPFDTVDELKLIEGWDDQVHRVFAPYLTVFPVKKKSTEKIKVNINTAQKQMTGCLFPGAKVDCREKFEKKNKAVQADGENIANNAGEIKKALTDFFCHEAAEGDGEGIKPEFFQAFSTVFRLEATGQVGTQEKKLTAVIERGMPDKAEKKAHSYEILYWKLL